MKEYHLDNQAKKEALMIARTTLVEFLSKGKIPLVAPKNEILLKPMGAFITLRNKNELRGCIGQIETKKPLYKTIQEMAISSATKDPRFLPVTTKELGEIIIEVSVLTPPKKVTSWQEIKLGVHGVIVEKGWNKGVFLPQVATETGWDLQQFLSALCSEKACLSPDCYKDPQTNLYVFEAQVFEE